MYKTATKFEDWLLILSVYKKNATYPVTTTKKSMMFQMFLRYDPLCKTKPKANIFKEASTQNIPKKYASVASCNKGNKLILKDYLLYLLWNWYKKNLKSKDIRSIPIKIDIRPYIFIYQLDKIIYFLWRKIASRHKTVVLTH